MGKAKGGRAVSGTTILLVRHTDVHNPGDVLYGRLPRFRLSAPGERQAEVTALTLAEEPVSVFYTSPQLRARQTARVISTPHPGAPLRVTRLLAEVLTGWQGRPHSDLETIGFNFYDNPINAEDESIRDLWRRIEKFVRMARRKHPGEIVVGVTHGDVSMLARAVYLRQPLSLASLRYPNVYPGKGSITRLVFPANAQETYPVRVDYYDPNSDDTRWSQGWVELQPASIAGSTA